jgi:hypothetical protein
MVALVAGEMVDSRGKVRRVEMRMVMEVGSSRSSLVESARLNLKPLEVSGVSEGLVEGEVVVGVEWAVPRALVLAGCLPAMVRDLVNGNAKLRLTQPEDPLVVVRVAVKAALAPSAAAVWEVVRAVLMACLLLARDRVAVNGSGTRRTLKLILPVGRRGEAGNARLMRKGLWLGRGL